MATKYNNADPTRAARTGGAVVITLALDTDGIIRGTHPTSLPCRGCWVAVRETNVADTYMSAAPNANPILCHYMPKASLGAQPLWIPTSDVAQLSFCSVGAAGDVVDVVYLLG